MNSSWLRTAGSLYLRRQVGKSLGTVEGLRNVSDGGGFVLVSNHASYIDHFVLDFLLEAVRDRPTWFLTKRESFSHPLLGAWARAWHGIAVDRLAPSSETVREVNAALAAGSAVCVYPEGTRNTEPDTLMEFKPGAFSFAASAQVPVVPVVMVGTAGVLPKGATRFRPGRIDVRFGEPISVDGATLKKTRIDQALKESRRWMEDALLEMRGARARDLMSSNGLNDRVSRLHEEGELKGKKGRATLFVVNALVRNNPLESEPLKLKARVTGLLGRDWLGVAKQLAMLVSARRLARVLRIQPNDSDAHYFLGTVRAIQFRRVQQAREHFQKAAQLSDYANPRPLLSLARLEAKQGDREAAVEALERAENAAEKHAGSSERRLAQVNALRAQLGDAA